MAKSELDRELHLKALYIARLTREFSELNTKFNRAIEEHTSLAIQASAERAEAEAETQKAREETEAREAEARRRMVNQALTGSKVCSVEAIDGGIVRLTFAAISGTYTLTIKATEWDLEGRS